MKRILLIILIGIIYNSAYSCNCERFDPEPENGYTHYYCNTTPIIFIGELTNENYVLFGQFRIIEQIKGDLKGAISIKLANNTCNYSMKQGEFYIVFAYNSEFEDNVLCFDNCRGTQITTKDYKYSTLYRDIIDFTNSVDDEFIQNDSIIETTKIKLNNSLTFELNETELHENGIDDKFGNEKRSWIYENYIFLLIGFGIVILIVTGLIIKQKRSTTQK